MSIEVDRTGTVFLVTADSDGDHRLPYSPGNWVTPEGQSPQFVATDIASLPDDVKETAQALWAPEVVAAFQDATAPVVVVEADVPIDAGGAVSLPAEQADDLKSLRKDFDALAARLATLEAKGGT